jgi:hypothetical protein
MGILDPRKPGLSNGIAKQEGFPTSGETSANAGALPAQRAQAPFQQNRAQTNMPQPTAKPPVGGGTLNGGAVQGAQYKTQAQNMNPGVASFVSIPQGLNAQPGGGFTPPQPAVPGGTKFHMQQQPQYFAGPQQGQQSQQQQQSQQASAERPQQAMPSAAPDANMMLAPSQPAPTPIPAPSQTMPAPAPTSAPTTGAAPTPAPTPTTDPANYDYLAEMQKMGQMYDVGGQYDLNQQALTAEKARQQNMQAWAQNQLAGRGGTATQAQQNYMNTMAALEADTARAQLAQGAHQTELSNRLTFNKQVANTKMDLVKMGNELGYELGDEAYNQIAYEIANSYQGGRPVSPGEMIDMLNNATEGKQVSQKQKAREQQISDWINNEGHDAYKSIYRTMAEMSDEEFRQFAQTELFTKAQGVVTYESPTAYGKYIMERLRKINSQK